MPLRVNISLTVAASPFFLSPLPPFSCSACFLACCLIPRHRRLSLAYFDFHSHLMAAIYGLMAVQVHRMVLSVA